MNRNNRMEENVMKCVHCGTENPEGAVFCMNCGKRADGTVPCPKCGAVNPAEAKFCIACGGALNEEKPETPAEAPETTVTTETTEETPVTTETTEETPAETSEPKKTRSVWEWLRLAGGLSAVAAAVFSLIFVFCIGVTANASVTGGGSVTGQTSYLYRYFYTEYREIGETLGLAGNSYSGSLAVSLYIPAALKTLVAVAALVAVPTLAAISIVRCVRSLRGMKGNQTFLPPAMSAFGVYLIASCLLLALNACSVSATSYGVRVSANASLNGATIAGTVLGGIFLFAGAGLLLASKGKEILAFRPLVCKGIFLGACVLTAIALSFAVSGGMSVSHTEGSITASAGYFLPLQFQADPQPFSPAIIVFLISLLSQTAGIILLGFLLVRLAETLSGRRRAVLPLAISAAVCALVYLVSTVLLGNLFIDFSAIADLGERVRFTYPMPIVLFVFSLLLLGATIAGRILGKERRTS